MSGKKQTDDQTKKINRNIYEDHINKVKERSKSKDFKAHVYERFWKMEGLFAEAKENHCLRRAKYRGIEKVQIQVTMISIVQNLKRMVQYTEKKLKATQANAVSTSASKPYICINACFAAFLIRFHDFLQYFQRKAKNQALKSKATRGFLIKFQNPPFFSTARY